MKLAHQRCCLQAENRVRFIGAFLRSYVHERAAVSYAFERFQVLHKNRLRCRRKRFVIHESIRVRGPFRDVKRN